MVVAAAISTFMHPKNCCRKGSHLSSYVCTFKLNYACPCIKTELDTELRVSGKEKELAFEMHSYKVTDRDNHPSESEVSWVYVWQRIHSQLARIIYLCIRALA